MNVVSVKLPHELSVRLANEARRRNIDRSTLVREILERTLVDGPDTDPPTCADLAPGRDLALGALASSGLVPISATNFPELLER